MVRKKIAKQNAEVFSTDKASANPEADSRLVVTQGLQPTIVIILDKHGTAL